MITYLIIGIVIGFGLGAVCAVVTFGMRAGPVERAYFRPKYRCIECGQPLTEFQRMYSHGVCPLCGHITPNSTICDTTKEAMPL